MIFTACFFMIYYSIFKSVCQLFFLHSSPFPETQKKTHGESLHRAFWVVLKSVAAAVTAASAFSFACTAAGTEHTFA
jgi:hypothetical protein